MSKITPRSLAECSGTSSLHIKVRLGVTNLECICVQSNTVSLVSLGVNNKAVGAPLAYPMQIIS